MNMLLPEKKGVSGSSKLSQNWWDCLEFRRFDLPISDQSLGENYFECVCIWKGAKAKKM